MALETVLSAIGGGLKGAFEGYSYEREAGQRDKQIANQEEIARLRLEVQQMIAELNTGSRERVAGVAADSRRDVAETAAGSRERVADTGAGVRRRGQDLSYDLGLTLEEGREKRWETPSGSAMLSSDTTRRGQDMGSATTRRGQDVTAGTARRGQDLNFTLGGERNALTERGQDIGAATAATAEAGRTARFRTRPSFSFDQPAGPPADVNLPAPAATPPVVKSPIPIAPRGARPAAGTQPTHKWPDGTTRAYPPPAQASGRPSAATDPAAGAGTPSTALAMKATAALTAYRVEKDPAKKKALAAELADLRRQIQALRTP